MNQNLGGQLQLGVLAHVLRRRWRVVAAGTLLAGTAALTIGLVVPPRYTAKAQIVLEAPTGSSPRFDDAAVETWAELLSTDSHIRRLDESLRTNPIVPGSEDFQRPVLSTLLDVVRATLAPMFGNGAQAPSGTGEEAGAAPRSMPDLDQLQLRLRSFKERASRVLSVTFTWPDPNVAAAIANRSATLFLEDNLQRQQLERDRDLRALRYRVERARSDVNRAGAAVARYRVEHGVSDADRADQTDAQIAEVSRQLAVASADLAARRQAGLQDGAVSLAAGRPAASQFSAGAAPVGGTDAATLEARVRFLVARLASLQEASALARTDEAQLRELRLEAASAAQGYEAVLRQEAELRDSPVQPAARLVSVANAPDEPSSPDPILFLAPALLVGAVGSSLLAIALDRLDRRVRDARAAEAALGVPCIGVVPRARRLATLHSVLALLREPFAPYTKAIRSVVMAMLGLSMEQQRGKVILVTSGAGREGKTTLALSFACYVALLRRKVLVIDLDLPSPSLVRRLGADDGPGVLEVLQGMPAEAAIRTSPEIGIDYLSLTPAAADPLLLIADESLRTLLAEMRRRYDCVVIDGAPLIGNPETRVLVALADHVLLALKWGSTRLDTARAALREIPKALERDGDATPVSAVLMQVDLRRYAIDAAAPGGDDALRQRIAPPFDHRISGA
ncbi:GumC family protein [Falsiroseomonas sp. HW251]|uniref:GumC family protein n=1 Tax=Falsiroseomonas sp. HW251 TaxID=3390998 RepID=UPI003D31C0B5